MYIDQVVFEEKNEVVIEQRSILVEHSPPCAVRNGD